MKKSWMLLSLSLLLGCAGALDEDNELVEGDEELEVLEREIRGGVFSNAPAGMVSIQRRVGSGWFHFCGGSLIRKRWVLTAAHCIDGLNSTSFQSKSIRVCVGNKDKRKCGASIMGLATSKRVHPRWNGNVSNGYDVGMLRLDRAIEKTRAVLGTTVNQPKKNQLATVYGWGRLQNGNSPNLLRRLTYRVLGLGTNRRVFTMEQTKTKGTCFGDSGGPAFRGGKQVGIVSYGLSGTAGSCIPSGAAADGYTNVAFVRSWIFRCTANQAECSKP